MPPGVGGGGAGSDGAIGVGAGFGTRFLAFALLAGFAFFIAFFLRDAPPRFDFFATSISRIGLTKIMQQRWPRQQRATGERPVNHSSL
jgi:hypothetical protein